MINCNNCGFRVGNNMKFALMKNQCPSCGGRLFSEKESNSISQIQNLLHSQHFSSKLNEQLVYDLSLFFHNELHNGIGKKILMDLKSEVTTSLPEPTVEKSGDDLKKIRDEVRNSVLAEYSEDDDEDSDLDQPSADEVDLSHLDPKVARLKRLANTNPILKKGAGGFRRVGSND